MFLLIRYPLPLGVRTRGLDIVAYPRAARLANAAAAREKTARVAWRAIHNHPFADLFSPE